MFPSTGGLLDMNALCRKPVNNVVRTAPLEFRIVSCRGDLNLDWQTQSFERILDFLL
jgi:hypothetical protein